MERNAPYWTQVQDAQDPSVWHDLGAYTGMGSMAVHEDGPNKGKPVDDRAQWWSCRACGTYGRVTRVVLRREDGDVVVHTYNPGPKILAAVAQEDRLARAAVAARQEPEAAAA